VGTSVPNEYISAVEKAFYECVIKGPLTNYPVVNCRYVLTDGQTHPVDSSQLAFATATKYSFQQGKNTNYYSIYNNLFNI
jgi:elongation factor G